MLKYAQLQLDENGFIANSHEVLKLFDANNRSYETMGIRLDGAAYGWVYDSESEILWHNGGTSNYNAYLILILNQPIDKLSAIISSFRVKLPCQATACLRSLSKVNGVT